MEFEGMEQLRQWIFEHLKVRVPSRTICPGHHHPMEYLWKAFKEPARDLVVWAPRGGGKTRMGAIATALDLIHKPGCKVRILGGSLEQSLRMWEHLIPDLECLLADSGQWSAKARAITLDSGSSAAILPQSQRAVRGLHVQKLRCDEVDMFDRGVWNAAQLVPKTSSDIGASGVVEAISTFHRIGGLMGEVIDKAAERQTPVIRWCLMEVLERCPQDRVCETCPLLPDCQRRAKTDCDGFFSIDDAIAMKQRVSMETWQSEMLCQRPVVHDAVFPSFEPTLHVREQVQLQEPRLWLGIDFGYRNPFVALWVWTDHLGRVFVIDEYVQNQRLMHHHIAEIRSRGRGEIWRIACDPAGNGVSDQTGKSDVKLLREAGYKVLSQSSQIADGLEMIRTALNPAIGAPSLFIHPRCKQLIKSMKRYRCKDNSEIPDKDGENDHLIDALRYFYINRQHKSGATASEY